MGLADFFRRKPKGSPDHLAALNGTASGAALGDARVFSCDFAAQDTLALRRVGTIATRTTRLAFMATDGDTGATASIFLAPADARRLAAAVLDLADEADGTAPLLWTEAAS